MNRASGRAALVVWLGVLVEVRGQGKNLVRPVVLLNRREIRNWFQRLLGLAGQQMEQTQGDMLVNFGRRSRRASNARIEIDRGQVDELLPIARGRGVRFACLRTRRE